tara:strand:- start:291 stop:542 length:252 start_codon:yes stop_codon:yes gene_type:complete
MFIPHTFDEFMNWKVEGWELPTSVCCIIRETDQETKEVKEHVYSKRSYAMKKIHSLMEDGKEFTICDDSQVQHMTPENNENHI